LLGLNRLNEMPTLHAGIARAPRRARIVGFDDFRDERIAIAGVGLQPGDEVIEAGSVRMIHVATVIRKSASVNSILCTFDILCDSVRTMADPISELRERVEGSSNAEVARELKISPQYLSDVLNDRKKPGDKILKALGLERLVVYIRRSK
jgi:hypothetical protein